MPQSPMRNRFYPDYLEIEPLKLECQHFITCVKTGQTPRTDGQNGYKVVKILEDAEKKITILIKDKEGQITEEEF